MISFARRFYELGKQSGSSEKPTNQDGLEEEIERYLPQIPEEPNNEELRVFARHFAEWGAVHRGSSEIPNDQPLPEDTVLFNKGVEEGKRLMMEEAVEADVNTYRDLAAGKSWAEFVVEMPTNNLGDKVRVIVIPKTDEK